VGALLTGQVERGPGHGRADALLALRVADRFRPQDAVRAHQLLENGGVRGRLVIEF